MSSMLRSKTRGAPIPIQGADLGGEDQRAQQRDPGQEDHRRAQLQLYEAPPSFEFMEDIEVLREVARLEHLRNPWPHTIGPCETVHGWYVLAMPHRPQGGEPEYTVTIEDEHGHTYSMKRLAAQNRRTFYRSESSPSPPQSDGNAHDMRQIRAHCRRPI